ncbi:MAG TPA: sugar ABC transporter ATP-binding protein [Spirochaetia bacterium]|nr:sugar ABC transporter ATP-binding protein [Spirochaetia bacterium]
MASLLEVRAVTRSYGPVRAVNEVSFSIGRGEIHSLVGENGAGKSTLVKMITGLEAPDSGEILLDGTPCHFRTPIEAREAGITVVYQDPKLFPHLDVAENIFMGIYPRNALGLVSRRTMYAEAKRLLAELDVPIDPRSLIAGLTVAEIQFVEIIRAMYADLRLLILDEPTASLTPSEADRLFALIESLKRKGKSIIFISHRLEEVRKISDMVTVMRDGRHVVTAPAADFSESDLVRAMVGRELESLFVRSHASIDRSRVILEVRNLSLPGHFRNVSFSIHSGEIVGMAGLVGAGRTEIAESIFGIRPPAAGEVFVNGTLVQPTSSGTMRESGVAYLPEDRDMHGLIMDMGVSANVTLTVLDKLGRHGVITRQAQNQSAEVYVRELEIRTETLETSVKRLSGGNRQKVVFAKWLATDPSVFILDEPTHGIDIGSKSQVHERIARLADQGFAVLLISSDLPEILSMCDRILVVNAGEIVSEFARDEANQEKVMFAATSGRRRYRDDN